MRSPRHTLPCATNRALALTAPGPVAVLRMLGFRSEDLAEATVQQREQCLHRVCLVVHSVSAMKVLRTQHLATLAASKLRSAPLANCNRAAAGYVAPWLHPVLMLCFWFPS